MILILDGGGCFRRNAQWKKGMSRFEQRGIYAAKVLNASKMGSQISNSRSDPPFSFSFL